MSNKIKITGEQILSDNWYILKKISFEYTTKKGEVQAQSREAYDRGNGATILLYNKTQQTVILTRQFRLPTFVNGNTDGMLTEACAGLLDTDSPEEAIRRETEEETGFVVSAIEKVYEAYMSPGSVTEKLYFFIAEYTTNMKTQEGGGIDDEEIEVIEMPYTNAMNQIKTGEIQDGKTIILLQHLALNRILNY